MTLIERGRVVHYLDTQELVIDFLDEMTYRDNVVKVLDENDTLRWWCENLIDAFRTSRYKGRGTCIADTSNLLKRYCMHRQAGACLLVNDTCKFREERMKGGDNTEARAFP